MDFLMIFGVILLLIDIIACSFLQLEVKDASCPQDIRNVKINKIALAVSTIVGVVLIILSCVV